MGDGYDGFISYSHAADEMLAPTLQSALQRYAKPWWRRRSLRVFRDQTGLSANPHLWTSIVEALDGSRFFVLLSSPDAARSDWVGKEIEHWVEHHGAEGILPVVTDGTWVWDPEAGDFDWERSTAVHPALRGVFAEEPRHVDMAWARSSLQLDHRDGRFLDAVAEIAAPLHGVAKDELAGEEVRQHRRTIRTAWTAASAMAVLLVIALAAGGLAVANAREADRAAQRAEHAATVANAGRLAALADSLDQDRADVALLLGVEASQRYQAPATHKNLFEILSGVTHLVGIDHGFGDRAGSVVDLASDGGLLAVGYVDGTVRLWDFASKRLKAERRQAHESSVSAVAIDVDRGRVVSAGADGKVVLWDMNLNTLDDSLAPQNGSVVFRLRLDLGGQTIVSLATGSGQRGATSTLRFSSIGASPEVAEVQVPGDSPPDLALRPDGGLVAVVTQGGTVLLVDTATRAVIGELRQGATPAAVTPEGSTTAAFTPDGASLVVGGDGDLVVWNVATRTVLREISGAHDGIVLRVAVSADGRTVVSTGVDRQVKVWDLETGMPMTEPLVAHTTLPEYVFVLTDGRIVSRSETEIATWDLGHLSLGRRVRGITSERLGSISASRNGKLLAVPGRGGSVQVLDSTTLEPVGEPLQVGNGEVIAVSFGANSRILAVTVSEDQGSSGDLVRGRVLLWDVTSSSLMREILLDDDAGARDVAVDRAGDRVAVTTIDAVHVFSVSTGERLGKSLTVGRGEGSPQVAFAPDSDLLLTIGRGEVVLHDASLRQMAVQGTHYENQFLLAAFSASGNVVAAARASGAVQLLDSRTLERLGSPISGLQGLSGVAVSPDGSLLAATGYDGTLLVWDVESRQEVVRQRSQSGVTAVAFVANDAVVTASGDGVTRWSLGAGELARRACQLSGRNLTRDEWDEFVGGEYERTCREWPSGE